MLWAREETTMKLTDLHELLHLPKVTIQVMLSEIEGRDPFYENLTREFLVNANKRHGKFPLVRALQYGVAICRLPGNRQEYFMMIEGSARRNVRKAERGEYQFQPIEFNDYLDDIKEIRGSTDTRQGELAADFLTGDVTPCHNPDPQTDIAAYPYFGVLRDGKLVAYAGCLITGELAMIEHIYGHAAFQRDGIVPMLIVGMAGAILERHQHVKYYGYGSYFGSGTTMRRFKRKFGFVPHKVKWGSG